MRNEDKANFISQEESASTEPSKRKASTRSSKKRQIVQANKGEITALEGKAESPPEKSESEKIGETRSTTERAVSKRNRAVKGQPLEAIPQFTAVLSRISFPQGSTAILLRDALGPIYQDPSFIQLFPESRQGVEAPWRLAIVTVLQLLETLSDGRAVECVRAQMDWKYALSLPPEEHFLSIGTLVQFRQRLQEPAVQEQVLKPLLKVCRQEGWLHGLSRQTINSNAVLETIELINTLDGIQNILAAVLEMLDGLGETLGLAKEIELEHIVKLIRIDWLSRYVYYRETREIPRERRAQLILFEQIGRDIRMLLGAIYADETPYFIRSLPMVKALQKVWNIHYGGRDGVSVISIREEDNTNR